MLTNLDKGIYHQFNVLDNGTLKTVFRLKKRVWYMQIPRSNNLTLVNQLGVDTLEPMYKEYLKSQSIGDNVVLLHPVVAGVPQ